MYLVRATIGTNDMDNKSVENCVCVLRNLSFRCQEVEDPDYDKHVFPPVQSRASAPIRGKKIMIYYMSCFYAFSIYLLAALI